jgi:RHS repeat-associated protein
VDGVTTAYLQDLAAGLPVVLRETTAGASTGYVYGLDLIASLDNSGVPSFFHADGLGSTRLLTDDTGAVTDRYSYDAFGAARTHMGVSNQRFMFTGEALDPDSRLYNFRDRHYDYSIGRFVSADMMEGSVKHPQTWNTYTYVYNNPIKLVDPAGFWGISPRFSLGYAGGLLGGGEVSGGVGPEFEFPSWNPLDWRVGFGAGTTTKVSTGPYAELTPKVGVSAYIWERGTLIPGASDAPLTSCGGVSGAFVAGGSAGLCTGQGKSGVRLGATLGASAGVSGFASVGAGQSWTWSLRDLWNNAVDLYNHVFGDNYYQTNEFYYDLHSYYSSGGYGGGAWGGPPGQGK